MFSPERVERLGSDIEVSTMTTPPRKEKMPMYDFLYIRLDRTQQFHNCDTLQEFIRKKFMFPEFPDLTVDDINEYERRIHEHDDTER